MMSAVRRIRHRLGPFLGPSYRAARAVVAQRLARSYSPRHYGWRQPILAVIGPARSGTQLVAHLLAGVPGYRFRWPYDPDRCGDNHDLCEPMFSTLPSSGYSVLKLHTKPTPANLALLDKYGVRAVVIYRDLRDESVSRYFAVLYDPRHRHHQYYHHVPKDMGIAHSIDVTLGEAIPWIRGWQPIVAKRPDRFHEVRFEALRPDPRPAFARIAGFYGFRLSASQVDRIVNRLAVRTRFDLQANFRDGRPTVRKGVVGDWRNHFTAEHVRQVKQGGGEFLIELGYERDLEWRL